MESGFSRRQFLKNSLYASSVVGMAAHAAMPQAFAQSEGSSTASTSTLMPRNVVNIGSNTLSVGPCSKAYQAIAGAVQGCGQYPRAESDLMLELLSSQLRVKPENISLYPGSGLPLGMAVATFTSPQAALVTADPTYEQAWRVAQRVGAKVIKVPQRSDYSHDVVAMCAIEEKIGMVYLCSPNNPTGAIVKRADIEYAVAKKPPGSVLLVDEAYIHFSENAVSAIDLAVAGEDVIVLRTFSKLYGMAGLRLGYAVGSKSNLVRMGLHGGGAVAMTTLAAGIASLQDTSLVSVRRELNTRLRNETISWLEAQGFACSISESNCFLVEIKRSAAEFKTAMASHGVMIGRSWPGFETQPRISVGTEAEMQRFRDAFSAVLAGKIGLYHIPERPRISSRNMWQDPEWVSC